MYTPRGAGDHFIHNHLCRGKRKEKKDEEGDEIAGLHIIFENFILIEIVFRYLSTYS